MHQLEQRIRYTESRLWTSEAAKQMGIRVYENTDPQKSLIYSNSPGKKHTVYMCLYGYGAISDMESNFSEVSV